FYSRTGPASVCGPYWYNVRTAGSYSYSLLIQYFTRFFGEPYFASIFQKLIAHTRRFVALGIHQRQIGDVNGKFFLLDLTCFHGGRAVMALDHIHALHYRTLLLRQHAHDFAALAFVPARGHDDRIAFFNFQLACHHNTFGAREMILVNFL